jgi:hypothetical protein
MAEEAPEAAESLIIYCPKCGNRTIAKLSFSGGDTLDYEGVCEGITGVCPTEFLITVTVK